MSLVLVLAFLALMVAVVPVAHALVIASGVALLWDGNLPLLLVVQQMFQQTQSFPMLALPFFILAGTLIMEGKLGEQLLRFAGEAMRRLPGGPLSTTVVGSVAFGGVSGSAVANASALGSVLIPWQKRQGYPAGVCAGQGDQGGQLAQRQQHDQEHDRGDRHPPGADRQHGDRQLVADELHAEAAGAPQDPGETDLEQAETGAGGRRAHRLIQPDGGTVRPAVRRSGG